jgi:hypothetical protein
MKTLLIISAIVSAVYSFLSPDMKTVAVANHDAVSIERTANLNP